MVITDRHAGRWTVMRVGDDPTPWTVYRWDDPTDDSVVDFRTWRQAIDYANWQARMDHVNAIIIHMLTGIPEAKQSDFVLRA